MNDDVTLAQAFELGHYEFRAEQIENLGECAPIKDVRAAVMAVAGKSPANVASTIAEAVRPVMDLSLGHLLAAGWNASRDLLEFKDPKAHPPTETSQYAIGDHSIVSKHHPRIRVSVNGAPVGKEVEFELEIELRVKSARLTIRDARILSAKVGSLTGKVTLACCEAKLLERSTREFELPGQVNFGEGFRIA
jgi:hypothetical protein